MDSEKYVRTSPEQFVALIEFMESHRDICMPQSGAQGHQRSKQLWQELAASLNSVNSGAKRTAAHWKRVWKDWKHKVKRKAMDIQKHSRGTGGGPNCGKTLGDLEIRVLNVMGNASVLGLGVAEHGFNAPLQYNSNLEEIHNSSNNEENVLASLPSQTSPILPPSPPPLLSPTPENFSSQTPSHRHRESTPVQSSPLSTAHSFRPLRTPRRGRNLRMTPFDRASSEWVAVERRRLAIEEARDKRNYLLEKERLKLESQRIALASQQTNVLQQFATIAQGYLDILRRQTQPPTPGDSSPLDL